MKCATIRRRETKKAVSAKSCKTGFSESRLEIGQLSERLNEQNSVKKIGSG